MKWKFEQNMTKEKLISRFLITFCGKFNSGLTALDVEPFVTLIVATVGFSAGIMSTSRLLSHQWPFWDNTGIYTHKSLLPFYILYCTIFIIVCCKMEAVWGFGFGGPFTLSVCICVCDCLLWN